MDTSVLEGRLPLTSDQFQAVATFSDATAWALDFAASSFVVAGTVIGGAQGAALPGGNVVTGPGGAALGWFMTELAVKPLTRAANLLGSFGTAMTVLSEIDSGETRLQASLSVGSSGVAASGQLLIGPGTQISA